jgi:putative membrane protein
MSPLLIIVLAVSYFQIIRRLDSRDRRRTLFFAAGLISLWLALDWPLGALGAGYLASVHIVQYLLIAVVAPPLLLSGLPRQTFDDLNRHPRVMAMLRYVAQPLIAFFIFNVVISVVHWPSLVDLFMSSQLGAFALDMTWLVVGLIFWWPVISPVPEQPGFTHLWKLAYLGLNGILIRPAFLFLMFSKFPAYATYELAPPIGRMTALSDQQLAAGIMKLGTAWIMVTAMAFVFRDWVSSSLDRRAPEP